MVAPRMAKWSLMAGLGLALGAMGWMATGSWAQPTTAPTTAPAGGSSAAAGQASATTAPGTQETVMAKGLKVVELQAGNPKAQVGDIVWVHYTGTLENGTKFDSSYDHPDRAPLQFKIGAGMVIQGWDEGIQGMVVGEKRRLTIPPALAYGEKGMGSQIPPNSTLVFEVELVGLARP